jgi:hypothetical protein
MSRPRHIAGFSTEITPTPDIVNNLNDTTFEYVTLKLNTSRNYDDPTPDDYGKLLTEGIMNIAQNPVDALKRAVGRGDTAAMLDLGMRFVFSM